MGVIVDGTAGITIPAGTVSVPSVNTFSDTNTGIYFPAADTVSFVGNGTNIFRIAAGKATYGSAALGTASAGLLEYDGRSTYFTPVDAQRGVVPGMQTYRLDSTVAGANSTAVQSVLGAGVTLNSSTVYRFNAVYALSKTAGATSHTISTLFGGTATLTNITYGLAAVAKLASSYTTVLAPTNSSFIQAATSTVITGALANATIQLITYLSGSVSINAGGTFIPQYQLSAAPGGAYTSAIGSYFEIWPVGQTGSNTSIGVWA